MSFVSVKDYPNQKELLSKDEVFSTACDIFIPAATEGTITEDNFHLLNTKIIY